MTDGQTRPTGRPPKAQGLYDPRNEHDACGVGAVVQVNGHKSHRILELGRQVIENLHHRGAAGADGVTGDGGGILFQMPDEFIRAVAKDESVDLPEAGRYAVGMYFAPKHANLQAQCEKCLVDAVAHYGLRVLGFRTVPGNSDCLGEIALAAEPVVKQIFIDGGGLTGGELEDKLYLIRQRTAHAVTREIGDDGDDFYLCSLSAKTILYKGMFMAHQLFAYYPDLCDERTESALCLVHQRYSTNTFPNWRLAQPFRMVCHNGEINTLSGNALRMHAREPLMSHPKFGEHLQDLFPILTSTDSDSAQFDSALELLVRSGRSLPHSLMMMIPEAFGTAYHISTDKRAFYEYHASIMEPWDGPAAMMFTDGDVLGGTLDRNGLRPARYIVTTDGLVVLGSEVGTIEFPPEQIERKGRLQPGKMFLVDTIEGRIVDDNEIKGKIARQKPYRRWLDKNRIELRGLFAPAQPVEDDPAGLVRRLKSFGYTREELNMVQGPMALNGQEPLGSMGTDTPLAILSERPQPLFCYFKQRFAQVTNPAIDPLREGLVMSLMSFTGRQRNLLAESPEHCRQLKIPHPILTNEDMHKLRSVKPEELKVATVEMLFDVPDPESPVSDAEKCLRRGLDDLVNSAADAIRDGATLIVLSDRNASETRAPIPSLLATSAVHHGLQRLNLRAEAGLIVESGEPREVQHFCLLSAYGANAVNPYVLFDVCEELRLAGKLGDGIGSGTVIDNLIAAITKGIKKVMSKMGISTLRSYMYAQLFDAVGLNESLIEDYFPGTQTRVGGIGLGAIATETLQRHARAWDDADDDLDLLEFGGNYHFRCDGENHFWNPETVTLMQHAVRTSDAATFAKYVAAVDEKATKLGTLRGLFEFSSPEKPVPLDEVEPVEAIVKRFNTGAISHGSISREAHECMAIAMNQLGAMSNTGEGGENPNRYEPDAEGHTWKNSAIKQVASGRFGVTINYLAHAKELQIKVAQGAKPGEGGHLPGHKVTEEIATMRFSTPGVSLISPRRTTISTRSRTSPS